MWCLRWWWPQIVNLLFLKFFRSVFKSRYYMGRSITVWYPEWYPPNTDLTVWRPNPWHISEVLHLDLTSRVPGWDVPPHLGPPNHELPELRPVRERSALVACTQRRILHKAASSFSSSSSSSSCPRFFFSWELTKWRLELWILPTSLRFSDCEWTSSLWFWGVLVWFLSVSVPVNRRKQTS